MEIKRDIGRKSQFPHTPLHLMPPLGGPHQNIDVLFRMGKLDWWGYLAVKNFEDMFSGVYSIPACGRRTDRWTNGWISCDSIVRAMHTYCTIKTLISKYSQNCRA